AWTLNVEFHASAGLGDLAGAVAFGTFSRNFQSALAMASGADILTGDVQAHDAAANRGPKGDIHLIFEVGAGLWSYIRGGSPASPENSRENVAKASATGGGGLLAAAGVVHEIGEIESPEIEVNAALVPRR